MPPVSRGSVAAVVRITMLFEMTMLPSPVSPPLPLGLSSSTPNRPVSVIWFESIRLAPGPWSPATMMPASPLPLTVAVVIVTPVVVPSAISMPAWPLAVAVTPVSLIEVVVPPTRWMPRPLPVESLREYEPRLIVRLARPSASLCRPSRALSVLSTSSNVTWLSGPVGMEMPSM